MTTAMNSSALHPRSPTSSRVADTLDVGGVRVGGDKRIAPDLLSAVVDRAPPSSGGIEGQNGASGVAVPSWSEEDRPRHVDRGFIRDQRYTERKRVLRGV